MTAVCVLVNPNTRQYVSCELSNVYSVAHTLVVINVCPKLGVLFVSKLALYSLKQWAARLMRQKNSFIQTLKQIYQTSNI